MAGYGDSAEAIKQRGEERQAAMLARAAAKNNMMMVKDEEMDLIVNRVEKHERKKAESLEKVKRSLHVDLKNLKNLAKTNRRRSLTQLVFCFVIMGCELDLLGFAGAFGDYWSTGRKLTQALLVAMPSSFVICVILYMGFIQPDEGEVDHKPPQEDGPASALDRARQLIRRSNIRLSWYHFLPLMRYVLLLKSLTKEDIEGIFRVNSLSSFTLGSCQMMGLAFAIMDNIEKNGSFEASDLSIFVYVNIVSQLVNWTITIAYFATSVSKNMQNAIGMDGYRQNLSSQMRTTLLHLQILIQDDAAALAAEDGADAADFDDGLSASSVSEGRHVDVMRTNLEKQICILQNVDIDLKYFEPIEILVLRRCVFNNLAQEYGNQ